jgi:hypothetical protein
MSAAFRSKPALRSAADFSGPGGIARASSKASWACVSRSMSGGGGVPVGIRKKVRLRMTFVYSISDSVLPEKISS